MLSRMLASRGVQGVRAMRAGCRPLFSNSSGGLVPCPTRRFLPSQSRKGWLAQPSSPTVSHLKLPVTALRALSTQIPLPVPQRCHASTPTPKPQAWATGTPILSVRLAHSRGGGQPQAAAGSTGANDGNEWLDEAGENGTAPAEGIGAMNSRDHGALHAINVAIAANLGIFVAKLAVYFYSGSSAMLAEAVHSIADVCNQALLRTGVIKSVQAPTSMHPYGYGRDRFVWSLISAVGIFCLGSGVSIVHGFNSMMTTYTLEHLNWGLTVLGVSLLLEGYSLSVAVKQVMKNAQARGMPFFEYLKKGDDPTTVAIVMEDGGAVAGLIIAGVCTLAAHMTGLCFYDSVGSIAVGTLLGFIAVFLIQKNRQLLIGRSMSPESMAKVMAHLKADPVVKAVYDAKSEELGPGIFRFKAEVDFCGATLVDRYLERCGRRTLYDKINAATWTADNKALDMVMRQYGREVVEALANEVDRIEMELRVIEPRIRHLDIEADRRPPLSRKALLGFSIAEDLQLSDKIAASDVSLLSSSIEDWNFKKGSRDSGDDERLADWVQTPKPPSSGAK